MDDDKATPEGGNNQENEDQEKLEVVGESLEVRVRDMDISFGLKLQ